MKTKIFFKALAATAFAAVTLTGCSEDAWNNKLDGFEEEKDKPLTNQQTVEYTLTDADYTAIAGNSTNKALAGDELKNALANVGKNHAFSTDITAQQYVPAFLASSDFPYFTLTDGSAVKLTYRTQVALPEKLQAVQDAQLYTVSSDDYKQIVWESDDNYIDAFAPSKKASRYMNKILLSAADPGDSEYCLVAYNEAQQDPIFGNVGGGDKPAFEETSVIGSAKKGDNIEAKAVITGICAQGYIATDKTGSILVYYGKTFDAASVKIGQQISIAGEVGAYNQGLQVTGSTATVEVLGEQAVTYPAPKVMTAAEMDQAVARSTDELAQYVQIKGVAAVSNYVNITIPGAAKAQGSLYQGTAAQKAAFTDGEEVTVDGYFIAVSSGKSYNMVVTAVNGKKVSAPKRRAPAAAVPSQAEYALYHFSNNSWSAVTDMYVLSPADYKSMNLSNNYLSSPSTFLPIFLKQKFPYAAKGDEQTVVYKSSDTAVGVSQYTYDGAEWQLQAGSGYVTVTGQFVKSKGKWMYDPSVVITLPAGRGQELSGKYFQACVDWVYENICVPLGDTSIKSGLYYVSSYGNNEYYSGTSAYQGNVDLRPDKAIEKYPAGYEGMSNAEVLALEKKRFMEEVMPGALAMLHPDVKPEEGVTVTYTINFSVYGYFKDGVLSAEVGSASTQAYTAVFEVVGPGRFAPVSCNW